MDKRLKEKNQIEKHYKTHVYLTIDKENFQRNNP